MALNLNKMFTFTWKIENFLSCYRKIGEPLRSPVFIAKTLNESHWYLYFYPTGKEEKDKQYVSVFLHRENIISEADEIDAKYEIELISTDGETLKFWRSGKNAFNKSVGRGLKEWIEVDRLKEKLLNLNDDTLVIKCRIFVNERESASHCTAWTKIGIERNSFKWNIANINSVLWTETKKFLCSQSLQIKITLTAPDDSVNITIQKTDEKINTPHCVTIKLSLLDAKGIEQDSRRVDYLFLPSDVNDIKEYPSFFTKTMLNNEEGKYLKNGMFTLLCTFFFSNGKEFDGIDGYYYDDSVNIQSTNIKDSVVLQEVFRRMYTEQIHSDVTLRTQNQAFKAHKSVLSTQSLIFSAMFDQDMQENQTGIVDMNDVEARILDIFLIFMYTGTVENMTYESASKLIIVADKYQVSTLKEKCSTYLISVLSDINVCDVLITADTLGDEVLKNSAVDYIIAHADNIFSSETGLNFVEHHAKLVTEIFHNLSTNFKNIKKLA